jgi:phage terminase small subunit
LELTDKQKVFVSEYVVDFNATRAAIKAGYSKDSARSMGNENLTKPYIEEAIQKTISELNKKCYLTRERIINEIASIAFDDVSNYIDIKDGKVVLKNGDIIDTKNIQEISVDRYGCPKIKLYSRDTALYKLAEYLGMNGIIDNNKSNDYEQELSVDELRGLLNGTKSSNNPKD